MTTADKMADDVTAELASLRAQVSRLMDERITPAVQGAAASWDQAQHRAQKYSQDQAAELAEKVRARPLASLAVVAGIGFLVGRIMR
jgi:ElaB/YqjD/DUF883 family membrane-anchored ribosome-binding protein